MPGYDYLACIIENLEARLKILESNYKSQEVDWNKYKNLDMRSYSGYVPNKFHDDMYSTQPPTKK